MDAVDWFKHRSYDYKQFSDLEALARRKRELGLTVSAVLPCRNVADTVRGFKEILEGKHDDVAEVNFYMKGGIDEIKEA